MGMSEKEPFLFSGNISSMRIRLKRRGLILAAVGACAMAPLTLLNSATQTSIMPRVQNVEEYAVYSAILNSQFARANVQQFVIICKTRWVTNPANVDRVASDVESDTISDFEANNEKSYLLDRRFDLKTPYVLIGDDEVEAMFNQKAGLFAAGGGWTRFYERYPGAPGLVGFSRVGFDSRKGQALVYFAFQRNYLGGSGRFFVLSRADESWKVKKQVVINLN